MKNDVINYSEQHTNIDELYLFLNKYDFFKKMVRYEIIPIQDYGRKSKFKIKTNTDIYTLILTEKRINPYINKFNKLGENFKKIIGFRYLSNDNKVLVLDYYGNDNGIDVVKLENSGYTIDDDIYVKQFKKIIDNIHSNGALYMDFSDKNYNTWDDYYIDEIKSKIDAIYNKKLINDRIYSILIEKLYKSLKNINNKYTFIHADITPLNVCINPNTKELYLIDYDDFKIGDIVVDISRIINFKDSSKLFKKITELYYKEYEDDINHLFYTLRVNINWYNHIIEKRQEHIYDLNNAWFEIVEIINRILKKNID